MRPFSTTAGTPHRTAVADPTSDQAAGWGVVQTVTREWVWLQLRCGFDRGSLLVMQLENESGDVRTVLVLVEEARQEAEANWLVRCRFLQRGSAEELNRLSGATSARRA